MDSNATASSIGTEAPARRIQTTAEPEFGIDTSAELRARADRIGRLTHRQFLTIRDLAETAGLAPQVAAVTAWLAADPQEAIAQLKQPRVEVIAQGITAKVIEIDVLTAPLIRAPDNLRMAAHRYEGEYRMPPYTSAADNSTLLLRLNGTDDVDTATRFYFTELAKVDAEITANNQYGDDIRTNGIRVGGILFPLVVEFAGRTPGVAGWETADSYGRAYFTQDAEGIEPAHVLEWLRQVPVDGHELARHPLSKRRAEVLSIAGKVLGKNWVARSEVKKLRRAVMPKTRLILSVDGDTSLDEVRRRVVALQHLDRPTPFSTATDWQTRAEAVLTWLAQRDRFARPGRESPATVRRWLDHPIEAVAREGIAADDIAMIAVASMLTSPGSTQDRHISDALRTRGVTGGLRSNARTEVVAHVVCRALRGGRAVEGPRSAMERALRWQPLRDQRLDMRPPEALLADALTELDVATVERSLGRTPNVGPATRQLVTRAAFHLICTPPGTDILLPRSAHGAAKEDAAEPDKVLSLLVTTATGLHQLAQAIFDGRRRLPVRRVTPGGRAGDHPTPPATADRLTTADLRRLAIQHEPVISDVSATAQVGADSHELRLLLDQVMTTVRRMATRTDAALPLVEERGWSDPHECLPLIHELAKVTGYWHQLHLVVNRPRPTDESMATHGGHR